MKSVGRAASFAFAQLLASDRNYITAVGNHRYLLNQFCLHDLHFQLKKIGLTCSPLSAALAQVGIRLKSATNEFGFLTGSSCAIGTK